MQYQMASCVCSTMKLAKVSCQYQVKKVSLCSTSETGKVVCLPGETESFMYAVPERRKLLCSLAKVYYAAGETAKVSCTVPGTGESFMSVNGESFRMQYETGDMYADQVKLAKVSCMQYQVKLAILYAVQNWRKFHVCDQVKLAKVSCMQYQVKLAKDECSTR